MLFLLSLSHFELKSSILDYFSILKHCIRTLTVGEPYNSLYSSSSWQSMQIPIVERSYMDVFYTK